MYWKLVWGEWFINAWGVGEGNFTTQSPVVKFQWNFMKVSVKFHSKFHKVIKYRYYTYILTVIMIYGNLAKKSEWVVSHEHKNIIQYYRVRPAWHLHIARTQYSRTLQYTTLSFFLVLPKRQLLWLSPEMWLRNSYF